MVKQKVQRVDIWLVWFDFIQGTESKKTRLGVAITPGAMKAFLIILPK